jgi:hypothetical protein
MTSAASALLAVAMTTQSAQPIEAQGKFEGTVTFEASGERGGDNIMVYSIKGSRIRLEPQSARMPMYMVMDMDDKVIRMVMTGQNMVMEMPMPDVADEAAKRVKEPVNTGRKDKVAGRDCEIWTMADDDADYEMCIARDMGMFVQPSGPMQRSASPAWQGELRKGGFFPLRVVQKKGSGSETVLVATKVEEKKLDDAMFTVPAGMQKMSMPPGMGRRP